MPVGRLVLDRMPDNFFAETEQVAFMTQNVVPGIDFSNDPLLQGRNFSYLDTQLKRLGGPNFTHICRSMRRSARSTISSRTATWRCAIRGSRELRAQLLGRTGPARMPASAASAVSRRTETGPKVRLRAESFADHYSQARQFFISQTAVEQRHIVMALVFELSKVETRAIRERMVSHLLNIDETLAIGVAGKLGIEKMPKPADAAIAPRDDLPASPALSIIDNGPESFAGRKVGVFVSAGADAVLLKKLQVAIEKEGAVMEVIAPKVGGVKASDGSWIEAKHMIDGGPSVLFDAVALVLSEEGADIISGEAAARDFVADAFVHCKFIAFTSAALPLLQRAGVDPAADEGLIAIDQSKAIATFIQLCRKLRQWSREMAVKL